MDDFAVKTDPFIMTTTGRVKRRATTGRVRRRDGPRAAPRRVHCEGAVLAQLNTADLWHDDTEHCDVRPESAGEFYCFSRSVGCPDVI